MREPASMEVLRSRSAPCAYAASRRDVLPALEPIAAMAERELVSLTRTDTPFNELLETVRAGLDVEDGPGLPRSDWTGPPRSLTENDTIRLGSWVEVPDGEAAEGWRIVSAARGGCLSAADLGRLSPVAVRCSATPGERRPPTQRAGWTGARPDGDLARRPNEQWDGAAGGLSARRTARWLSGWLSTAGLTGWLS